MRTAEDLVASVPHGFADAVLVATALGRVTIAGVALREGNELRLIEVRGMPPDSQDELLPLCRQTVEADDLVVFARPRRSSGRIVHYFAGVPIRADDRQPVGAVFIADRAPEHFDHFVHDALWVLGRQVERERDAERAAKAAELRNRVASMAHRASDVREALRFCLDEICAFTGWPVGHAYVPADNDGGDLIPARLWCCADEDGFTQLLDIVETAPGSGLPGDAAAEMCPKWMERPDLAETGVSSAFAFPVFESNRLIAVLEFFDRDVRPPSPYLVDLVTELGRELGLAAARIGDRVNLVHSQLALRDTVHQLRKIISTAHDAFIALDGDGVVTEWNKAAENMFGWSRDQILGLPLADTVVPDRYRADHLAGIARLKATGEGPVLGRQVELTAVRRDGLEFPIELLVWEPRAGGEYRFNAFIRDISERKQAERALRDAFAREQEVVEELRRLDRAKTDFVANVSHELRTPLTSISGYLELLVDTAAGEQVDMMAVIQRNTQRLLRLVEDVLTVGKMDSGQFQPKLVPTDLGALVATAVKSIEPSAAGRSVTLVSQVGSDPIRVLADPNQLDRALLNLLSNAVKFTQPAGSVSVRVRRAGSEARITVADTGIGIPADELPRLFSRFFRSSLAAEHEIQGTGLGLAIVKHIVEQHGGRISVSSRPGEGTMVTIMLPVDPQP